jgi:pimeloyl-ACP methyl ester carboxylesterase
LETSSGFDDFPQDHINRSNRNGGVNDLADFWWIVACTIAGPNSVPFRLTGRQAELRYQPDQFHSTFLRSSRNTVVSCVSPSDASPIDRRIRAAVIAAPALGFTFDEAALSKADIPIQLWRAEDDVILPHPWYSEIVRVSLPRKPEYHVVPRAGHFDFLAPCTEKLASMAPQICVSREGFDRTEFHRRFNSDVIGYFKKFL